MDGQAKGLISITRKASKQHKCCECLQTIEKGQRYQYSSGIWDNGPASFKQCLTCSNVMDEALMIDPQSWVSFGSVADWFIENMDEISESSLDDGILDQFLKLHNIEFKL